jgi:hypothetical protein
VAAAPDPNRGSSAAVESEQRPVGQFARGRKANE